MKAIILAGGSGTRLHPSTLVTSKQLLPVYDKPMIYYPLSVLILAGISEILIISTPHDLPQLRRLLGSGADLGVRFDYCEQQRPEGLAQAFILGASFIGNDNVAMILGDNIFYGHGLAQTLQNIVKTHHQGARVFGYWVRDPERYGVLELGADGKVLGIEEKPAHPKSNYVVPGLYFYDHQVVSIAQNLKPSARGELEITDINRVYLQRNQLKVDLFSRGYAWLDTGTPEALLQAANFIAAVEERQGLKIGCVEEVAFRMGLISAQHLAEIGRRLGKSDYGAYLSRVALEKVYET